MLVNGMAKGVENVESPGGAGKSFFFNWILIFEFLPKYSHKNSLEMFKGGGF